MEPTTQKSVLIVDDEPAFRDLLSHIFSEHKVVVHTAENAEKALEIALAQKPTAIVTDLMMPGTSGIEFITKIRGIEAIAKTFIVVLTNSLRPNDVADALSEDVTIFLQKADVDPISIYKKINDHVHFD
jgi:CheY-like chemotaxis protein